MLQGILKSLVKISILLVLQSGFQCMALFLNAAVFIKFFLIRVWYLMESGIYMRAVFI